MSTPTINVTNGQGYPALSDIMNLVRALVNDSQAGATGTPGEGQIITNNAEISPFTQPFLNSAIREVYRELRNVGQPTLIKDNVIIFGLTPVNSPTYGLGQPDPTVQVVLGFNGYFDGVQTNSSLLLPGDLLYPLQVQCRTTGSNNPFTRMTQCTIGGLPNGLQTTNLGQWEWRQDAINMNGSLTDQDVRLRYLASLPTFFSEDLDLSSTFVPVLDSLDAIAYKVAVKYATMLGSPGLEELRVDAKDAMFQLKNANVRQQQTQPVSRIAYGHSNGSYAGMNGLDAFGQ